VFARHLEFNLSNGFPLLTTKRVFWKGIVKELLWFLRGNTDATLLSRDGVRIWDANTTEDALKARQLPYREGDAGPVYGFQWRHWGADYSGCDGGPYGGHDQLATLVRNLREDPMSRRHIVSAWNVEDLDRMALPPCHILFQCYVNNNGTLDLQVYQRSVDIGLGLPFNIASYATLVHLLASLTDRVPGRLIMSLGDCHIYRDHIDTIEEQLKRRPHHPPRLLIKNNKYTRLDQFSEGDIKLVEYAPHGALPMHMSA
jgi:thymidylate synthase